ncbi:hypothetical protein [Hymenobacter antarcticus]|uniref:Cytochrome c domain-containing protein n=1 Tax=Hymenobacter antarcticus TaxID=486270 RepID=A0ABP7QYK3_9BACT
MSRILLLGVAALLGSAAGCTYANGDQAPIVVPCDATSQTVTYSKVISPIFDANCRQCHASNVAFTLGGGVMLGDYQSITRYGVVSLLGSIEHSPGYDPMPKGRAKMAECDIVRIRVWLAAGTPNN